MPDDSKHRFTIDVSDKMAEAVHDMSKEMGVSSTMVFRTAAALLVEFRKAKADGMSVGAWKDTEYGRHEQVFVGMI